MKNCNTNGQYTISVPEDNSFAVVYPLKRRTFVAQKPIDTDINCAELQDVVLTIGGVEYPTECGLDGVRVVVAEGLKRGIYDVIITATYHGSLIRAAYFESLRSVEWNYQSDAQNYLPGSPIVAQAAYIIGGVLDDAELAALKEQYRQAIIAEQEAEAEAQAKVEEYAERIEHLDNLATDEDVSGAATTILEALAAVALSIKGDNTEATNTAIKALLGSPSDIKTTATVFGRLARIIDKIDNIDFSEITQNIDSVKTLLGTPQDLKTAATVFGRLARIIDKIDNIDFSEITQNIDSIKTLIGEATDPQTAATIFGKLAEVLAAISNIDFSALAKQEQLLWLNQFWGIVGATEYEAATEQEIIDELSQIWEDEFGTPADPLPAES